MKHTNNKKPSTHNQPPLVSVVIPVFNGASYLEEAVDSVEKSTFRNFEVLLINDGSLDKSKQLCHKLEKKYRNVHFYDFDQNRGLARTLNFALMKARGKYVARLNQDDHMLPHRLKTQVEYMEKHPEITVLGSSIRLFENDGASQIVTFLSKDEDIKKLWYIVSPFADPSVMYRRQVALSVGGYDQYYWPGDDTHLWYRMGMAGKLANLKTPVVNVRWHNGAASVVHFRRLALKTFQIHLWANNMIKPAPWYIWLFWICQLAAGYTLSPQFNWNFYRTMKRFIAILAFGQANVPQPKRKKPIVKLHPTKANLSGVYIR